MDQNLEESLNLGSAMGVDFGQEDVVIQSEIPLQQTSSEEIQMDYENTEEHSMLMDTESEEIIVSDFMGDSLSIEYTLANEHQHEMATLDPNHGLSSQSDTIVDLQYEPQATVTAIKPEQQPKIITVKTVTSIPSHIKRTDMGVLKPVPRQIAIAPKPMPTASSKPQISQSPKGYGTMGHIAIAPKPSTMSAKPVTLVANRGASTILKKVSIAGVSHGNTKSSSVLAQIGKQLIMVPSGGQKIKLVTSSSVGGVQYITTDSSRAQVIPNKNVNVQQNKLLTKLITVQGQSDVDNQPVVITKMMPEGSNKPLPRFVTVPQKPISIANKVLLSTPTKQVTTMAKKHEIIAIHAPNTKIAPAPNTTAGSNNLTENKVLIPANPAQKVMLKPALSQNTTQIGKKTNYVVDGQTTQLHQINVPGKGVQYIRLITNPSAGNTANMKTQNIISVPSKTFVLTDNKGNQIQLSGEMMKNGQPPSLVMTNTAKLTKVPQKLVRIAPIAPKTSQATTQPRPSQSLLAPLSPVDSSPAEYHIQKQEAVEAEEIEEIEEVEVDSKESIRDLLEARVVEDTMEEQSSSEQVQQDNVSEQSEHPEQDLIVIPSNYNQVMFHDKYKNHDERADLLTVNVEGAPLASCPSPAPAGSEADMVSTELGLRPRKACNCTKSQCLKLYCDCFANGEFCNRCNCNNCHNNLDNEELRQKAIRGCLDRNPNAFRPKIGKTKSGGPEIVRRHNKGCNCKRSGCLKNYCECYEAKIACTAMCKCVGCRNVEDSLERSMRYELQHKRFSPRRAPVPPAESPVDKQPCAFMTSEVIDAVCQCLVAVAADRERAPGSPVPDVIEEFARCLQDIIGTAYVQPHREGAA